MLHTYESFSTTRSGFSIRCLFRVNEKSIDRLCRTRCHFRTVTIGVRSSFTCSSIHTIITHNSTHCAHTFHTEKYYNHMRIHANKQAICNSYWILSHFSAKGNKNHHTIFIRSNRWLFIHSTCKQIEFFSFSHDFSTCVTLNVAHIMVRVLDWRSQSTFWFGKRNKFGIVVYWIGTHEFVPRWDFFGTSTFALCSMTFNKTQKQCWYFISFQKLSNCIFHRENSTYSEISNIIKIPVNQLTLNLSEVLNLKRFHRIVLFSIFIAHKHSQNYLLM